MHLRASWLLVVGLGITGMACKGRERDAPSPAPSTGSGSSAAIGSGTAAASGAPTSSATGTGSAAAAGSAAAGSAAAGSAATGSGPPPPVDLARARTDLQSWADKICGCKDKACAKAAMSAHALWEKELIVQADRPPHDVLVRALEADAEIVALRKRATDCTRALHD